MPDPASDAAPGCRWCGSRGLHVVLDLGVQPPADFFPSPAAGLPDPAWPLRMAMCGACGLAQLVEDPGQAEEPLGTEPLALVAQAEQAVAVASRAGLFGPGRTFVEFDSPHGGSWRTLLTGTGTTDRTGADGGDEPGAAVDVVVDVFGMMHEPDQADALRRRVRRLAPGGSLLLQYHSLATIVAQHQWNSLRHGHMAYYSTRALVGMLAAVGMTATRAWSFPLYGGTVLLEARSGRAPAGDAHLEELLLADDRAGVMGVTAPGTLQITARQLGSELREWLSEHRRAGRTVIGYAAASRAVPLLVAAGVGPDLLPAIADGSAAKDGLMIPGVRIPIVAADELARRRPDVVLVFVPDLLSEVRAAWPAVEEHGGRWAVSEPRPRLIEPL